MAARGVKWAIMAPAHGTMMYVGGLKNEDGCGASMHETADEGDLFDTKAEAEALAFEFTVYNPEDIGRVRVQMVMDPPLRVRGRKVKGK